MNNELTAQKLREQLLFLLLQQPQQSQELSEGLSKRFNVTIRTSTKMTRLSVLLY